MAIAFKATQESDFPNSASFWGVFPPNAALPGDYLLVMVASLQAGVIWSSPGWEQLDGFSTVSFTMGGALAPVRIPVSYAIFAHFLEPADTSPFTFAISSPPTAVIGAAPGAATGVALTADYAGVNRSDPIRDRALTQLPLLQINYGIGTSGATSPAPGIAIGPLQTQQSGPYVPITAAPVPAVFAAMNDVLLSPIIAPSGQVVSLPGPNSILRGTTTGGPGIIITLADQLVTQGGYQNQLQWGADLGFGTPLITEALSLWPDQANLDKEISIFASLGRDPATYDYIYSQEPRFIVNEVGYLIKIYASRYAKPSSLFASNLINNANLLLTRPDGSTLTVPLTMAPDGTYAFCTSGNTWFQFSGRYVFQLQIVWGNGSVEFSSQIYGRAYPQGGQ